MSWPFEITTERLVLRPWTTSDADALVELQFRNHEHLAAWLPWARSLLTEAEMWARICTWQEKFVIGEHFLYGMLLEHRPIGEVGLHPCPVPRTDRMMLSYWVDRDYEGKGYVSEAVQMLAFVAEQNGLGAVEIYTDPKNVRSESVARRLGFTRIGAEDGANVFVYSFSASDSTSRTKRSMSHP